MDDLLREFLTETSESLDTVDNQLVRFEQDPNNAKILDNIFRLVHTIKGTCGFLGLPRLEALAHAAETLMGKFRDGMPVTAEAVSLILTTIDRIKEILAGLEATEAEPEGTDQDLIDELQEMVERGMAAMSAPAACRSRLRRLRSQPAVEQGTLVPQVPRTPVASRRSVAGRAGACVPRDRDRGARRRCRPAPAQLRRRRRQSRPPGKPFVEPEIADGDRRSPTSRSASMSTRSNI